MRKSTILDLLMFPGLILHELSHALAVLLTPNSKITNFELTLSEGEVEYEYKPTATRTFLISFAPFFVNTTAGSYVTFKAFEIYSQTPYEPTQILMIAGLLGLSISLLSQSLPSYKDSVSTIQVLKSQLISIRFPLIITIGLVFFTICLPAVIFSRILELNRGTYYLVSIGYASIAIYILFGFFQGHIEPHTMVELSEQAIARVRDLPNN